MIGRTLSLLTSSLRWRLLCLLAAGWPAFGLAADPWDELTTPFFHHLTVPRDVPNAASMVTQDSTGLIWIGTQDGLARWDGYRSKLFRHDPQDPHSLPANLISAVGIDERGTLFVATGEGIVGRYDRRTENFTSLPATTTGTGFYTAFLAEGDGEVWMGNSNGLSHYIPASNAWEIVELPDHIRVWSLLRGRSGALWAGTDHGLFTRPAGGTAFERAFEKTDGHSPLRSNIRSLREAGDGSLWFGTHDGKVGMLTPDGRVVMAQMPIPSSAVTSLVEIKAGLLCAATAGNGLVFLDGATGEPRRTIKSDAQRSSGLADDFVFNLFKDQSGGLWVSHFRGADYIPSFDESFQAVLPSDRNPAALGGSDITTISPQPGGDIWIGTEKGIDVLSLVEGRYKIRHLSSKGTTQLPRALIHDIVTAADGTAWIATGSGLYQRKGDTIRHIDLVGDDTVRTLLLERDSLWLGMDRRGLVQFDLATGRLTTYQHDTSNADSISDNFVLSIKRDPHLGLWVGTQHGLNLFDGKHFHTFFHDPNDPDSIPADAVATVQFDPRQRLWIGTHGGGIGILEGDPLGKHRFLNLTVSFGLPNANIGTLLVDKTGTMWASADEGVAKIDPESLRITGFNGLDGLAIASHFVNSGARLPDGSLLFGGLGGINVVHPDRFVDLASVPHVVPVSLRIGQNYVPVMSAVTLSSQNSSLQVEFSALDYGAPERNRYSYRLDGFDSDWIAVDSNHRIAAYTKLPPGSFTLLVRASNRDGVWSDPTRLPVTVLPAWYQTLWFKALVAIAALALATGIFRSRTAYLRRRQKELEGQVAERTAEIASLLHNSGEGFLSLGPDLTIDRQFSRACETFFGETPAGKQAASLLFAENPKQAAFFTESVPTALTSSDAGKRDLILSLLPKEIERRGRQLKAHYAILENGHLMVVLRDTSTERRLAQRVASEHRRLGMIVAAVTDSRDFFNTLNAFNAFTALRWETFLRTQGDPQSALQETYRRIHTFKGEFNQFSLEKIPAALHELEERLDDLRRSGEILTHHDIATILASMDFAGALQQDLSVIRKALGDDFLDKGGQVSMTPEQATLIKELSKRWRRGEQVDLRQPEIRALLDEIDKVGSVSLHAELAGYDQTIAQVALKLEKEVSQLSVIGGEDIRVDPDMFGPFLRSLVHVFRNCVTHGIEAPELRLENGKDEVGLISCIVTANGDDLSLVVADDGAGLDLAALRQRLVSLKLYDEQEVKELSDEAVAAFVFRDHISTAGEIDQWSGRGIGLAAVRQEVEKLGGTIMVESTAGQGTRFKFQLKLQPRAAPQAA